MNEYAPSDETPVPDAAKFGYIRWFVARIAALWLFAGALMPKPSKKKWGQKKWVRYRLAKQQTSHPFILFNFR